MKISEMIAQLEDLKEKHGDLPVGTYDHANVYIKLTKEHFDLYENSYEGHLLFDFRDKTPDDRRCEYHYECEKFIGIG